MEVLVAEQGQKTSLDLTVIDVVEILRDAIKEIVGNGNQRTIEGLGYQGFAAVLEDDLIVLLDVEASDIQDTLLEEGLKTRAIVPDIQIGLGKVGENIAKVRQGNLVSLTKIAEMGQKVKGKATRSCAQFAAVERLRTPDRLGLVLPACKDDFSVGRGNGGVTGNVVGNFALGPGVHAPVRKVVSL